MCIRDRNERHAADRRGAARARGRRGGAARGRRRRERAEDGRLWFKRLPSDFPVPFEVWETFVMPHMVTRDFRGLFTEEELLEAHYQELQEEYYEPEHEYYHEPEDDPHFEG